MTQVPIVDIAGFARGDEAARAAIAGAVDRAFREIGFLTIVGHGLEQQAVEDAFASAYEFFALPQAEKDRYAKAEHDIFPGYNAVASERSDTGDRKGQPPDLRENFLISRLDLDDPYYRRPEFGRTYWPNIWPERPARYRPVWERFYRAMEELSFRFSGICATALGVREDWFVDKIDRHSSTCAANHYPAQPDAPLDDQLRAGAHSDVGGITLLIQENKPGGLQVLGKDGAWHGVTTPPGAVIVNIGDLMAQWTNDRWVSTRHRVVNPPREFAHTARMSLSFFQHPNFDAVIECVPTCTGPGNPPKYPPVWAGIHMTRRMLAAREWAKLDAAAQ